MSVMASRTVSPVPASPAARSCSKVISGPPTGGKVSRSNLLFQDDWSMRRSAPMRERAELLPEFDANSAREGRRAGDQQRVRLPGAALDRPPPEGCSRVGVDPVRALVLLPGRLRFALGLLAAR